jgi:thiamine-phosphate pyrophosphorylase
MKPLSECYLYAFVDTSCLRGRAPATVAQQLCDGGADLIQVRAKGSSLDEIRRIAAAVAPITRPAGVGLIINDHLSIAREVGADFCHLGQEDFFGAGHKQVAELRPAESRLGIGLSTHGAQDAQRAIDAGADYIAVGPVFATATKPEAEPLTLESVRWAAANISLPWFAIGGINLANLPQVLAAGARRICVVSAILNAADVVAACRQFKKLL